MRGYLVPVSSPDDKSQKQTLPNWASLVVGAVGTTIEFWGFKANHGRVWAYLYLEGKALSALEIQTALGLSKGAVSMVTRELEQWQVVQRVRAPHGDIWQFAAETDLLKMVSRVISEREARFIERISADLKAAEEQARVDRAPREVLERIGRMRSLAHRAHQAVEVFLATSRFDFRALADVFSAELKSLRRKER